MISEKAYAKVNLGLKTINKRPDNYHNLDMITVSIDRYDSLTFKKSKDVHFTCKQMQAGLEDNLVLKTVKLMKDRFNIQTGVKIRLAKRIKIGGGLGGGSSDAASTIRGLNRIWKLNLTDYEMEKIALEVGSDVPFCIQGIPARVMGRGEVIKPFLIRNEIYLVIVCPDYSMSTKEVFSRHKILQSDENQMESLRDALMQPNMDLLRDMLKNDLETTVEQITIEREKIPISEIKHALLELGCLASVMSGSGSTVVGIVKKRSLAVKITKTVQKIYPDFEVYNAKIRQNRQRL